MVSWYENRDTAFKIDPSFTKSSPFMGKIWTPSFCNIFMNSVEFVTVSSNLLCQLVDHLLQFFVLKDFRVSYRPKHEQIFKCNYRSFNNNEFKNEINQIDWKTLFGSFCIFVFAFLMTMHHQSRKYRKRRNLSLTNQGLTITYDI